MTELNIVPECYVDTKVAEILGQASKKYNHQHGCGDVANELKNRLRERVALGIIDEDKHKGPAAKYFSEFNLVTNRNNLILKKHRTKKQYLILICPEIENWLVSNAASINIDPADYNLPDGLKNFKRLTKIKDIDKNIDFYRFIKELMKMNAPGINTLKDWIALFKLDQLDSLAG